MDKGSRSTGRASIFIFISFLPYVKFYILTLKVQEVENLVQEEILMYLIDQYTVILIQVTFTGVPFYLYLRLGEKLAGRQPQFHSNSNMFQDVQNWRVLTKVRSSVFFLVLI